MKLILPALPLLFGFLLDACIGDPPTLPHPIRWIGNLIAMTESFIRKYRSSAESRFDDCRTGYSTAG